METTTTQARGEISSRVARCTALTTETRDVQHQPNDLLIEEQADHSEDVIDKQITKLAAETSAERHCREGEMKPLPATIVARVASADNPSCEGEQEEVETCLICMEPFSETKKRDKRMPNPCSNQCNPTPMHPRCIYFWKEASNGRKKDSATCPLCRGPLSDIEYTPPDHLRAWTFKFLEARRAFVLRPVMR
jgi:hypothetical protein